LDLYSGIFSCGLRVHDHIFVVFQQSGSRVFTFSSDSRAQANGKGYIRINALCSLDWQILRLHYYAVQDPVTKKLGDILYADRSKIRVSEEEWLKVLRAIAGGDQAALHFLYEQMHRIVFTLIVRITMNRETAEEVTLDVFYDVWRKASTYDPANGSVVGWIMNQARSRAIDRLRFDQRKKKSKHVSGQLAADNGHR